MRLFDAFYAIYRLQPERWQAAIWFVAIAVLALALASAWMVIGKVFDPVRWPRSPWSLRNARPVDPNRELVLRALVRQEHR